MGEATKIEWCDATFNAWVGCTKVSPACDHCYAEGWAKRTGHPELWQGDRRRTTASNWREPIKWNKRAAAEGRRLRVFCSSLADVFDNQVPEEWRADLWRLIDETPSLDWLLLTKRPQNAGKMIREARRAVLGGRVADEHLLWPWPNVWLGTTVENQGEADRRIPHLLAVPAKVHFLSCEPLLGPLDLARWLGRTAAGRFHAEPIIDWIITGGESGPGARPAHPDWFRSLRDQCAAAGVPFFFKQWGEWHPSAMHGPATCPYKSTHAIHVNGEREFRPGEAFYKAGTARGWAGVCHVGKKVAGAMLDGREHREFPT